SSGEPLKNKITAADYTRPISRINIRNLSNKIKIQRVHSEYYVVNGKACILKYQGEWVTPFDTPTDEEKTAFKNFLKQF
ncbi:hypothetical protein ACQ1PN_11970, partial [Ornithobacterium rhinotracheale]